MKENIKIIRANIDALKEYKNQLIDLINYSYKVNSGKNDPDYGINRFESLLSYYSQGKARVNLCIDDKKLIGYTWFFLIKKDRFHLNEIAVFPQYKRQGIGNMLLADLERIAKEESVDYIELNCWEKNINAKEFYYANNFAIERYLMSKKLTS